MENTGEGSKEKVTKKKKRFHCDGKRLPETVYKLMEKIQEEITDTHSRKDRRPKTFPEMPSEFICTEVKNAEKRKKMVELCDSALSDSEDAQCLCYEIFVPFRINEVKADPKSTVSLVWLNELIISFKNASVKKETSKDLVVIEIEQYRKRRNAKSRKRPRTSKYAFKSIPKEDAVKKLPSKMRSFFKGKLKANKNAGKGRVKLVGRYNLNSNCLISSHRMTVSWLRSRLHRAVHKCLSNSTSGTGNQPRLVPLIRQKEGGPLFLQLPYEKKKDSGDGKVERCNALFSFYPAFRVGSHCDLVVPVVPHFDTLPVEKLDGDAEEFLWKRITKCLNKEKDHQHEMLKIEEPGFELATKSSQSISKESDNSPKERAVCEDVKRDLTASQKKQCRECRNPASRMLLEYYYQYSYIPEEEMSFADSFVDEILLFIKRSIQKDRRSNDPKVLEFVKSGSVLEKLKVVQPDEFDVMVKIRLPESKMQYSMYSDDAFLPGFAICSVKRKANGPVSPSLKQCFFKVGAFETEHCLNPEKLAFGWLYGMLQRAINKYKSSSHPPKANLKIQRGGPALMLQITPNASTPDAGSRPPLPKQIKVDLVLALERSSTDDRLFVPKRAKLKSFYKRNLKRKKLESSSTDDNAERTVAVEPRVPEESENNAEERENNAKNNHSYMWRISYSTEEKEFLEYVEGKQGECGVQGCQKICLKIFKTICMREGLKSKESVICHKLSSYILKTTLFHMLSESDLKGSWEDWKIECLAERYEEFLCKLSQLGDELPHFFFGNQDYLSRVFHDVERRCKEMKSIDLLEDLHATLLRQIYIRIFGIAKKFKKCKKLMDEESTKEFQNQQDSSDSADSDQVYLALLEKVLGGESPEEIIHPSVVAREKSEEDKETIRKLKEKQQLEEDANDAVKNEQRSGSKLNMNQNMRSAQVNVENKKSRKRKLEEIRQEDDDDRFNDYIYSFFCNDDDDENDWLE